MGVSCELAHGIIRIETPGGLDQERGLRAVRDALSDASSTVPESPLGRWSLLFDLREYGDRPSADELRRVAALVILYRDSLSGLCAIIGPPGPGIEAARAFGEFLEGVGQKVGLFSTPEDAAAWIRDSADGEPGPAGSDPGPSPVGGA